MPRQLPKRDSTIVLQLVLSAAEARMLRDELGGQLAEMRLEEDASGMFDESTTAFYSNFDRWIESRQNTEYSKKLQPVLEKTVKALRVALGLKPEIPDLSNIPAGCGDNERSGTREEYKLYLELKKKGLREETQSKGVDVACTRCAETLFASYVKEAWRYDGKVYTTFDALCARLLDDFQE
jgi:hypothetical protein